MKVFLLLKASTRGEKPGHKYFKRIPKASGKGWIYFYTEADWKKHSKKKETKKPTKKPTVKRTKAKKTKVTTKKKKETTVISAETDYGRDKGKKVKSGRIPGSKLEMVWQKKFGSFGEMEATGVGHKIINKKNLIADQTSLDLHEKMGREPLAAFLFNKVVGKLRSSSSIDTKEARKLYYDTCNALIDSTKNAKTVKEMSEGLGEAKDRIDTYKEEYYNNPDLRNLSAYKHIPQILGNSFYTNLHQVVYRSERDPNWYYAGVKDYDQLRKIESGKKEIRTEASKKAKETRKKRPIELEEKKDAKRTGLESHYKNEKDAHRSFEGEFKFRTAPQHGKSLTDEERKYHTLLAANSFNDLADILGLQKEQITANGKLALAFGARGSGAASAHYEPSLKVINLTRNRGGGSLAHEWGHFLDNIIPMYIKSNYVPYHSYFSHLGDKGRGYSGQDENLIDGIVKVMKAMKFTEKSDGKISGFHKDGPNTEYKYDPESIQYYRWGFGLSMLEQNNNDPIEALKAIIEERYPSYLNKRNKNKFFHESYTFLFNKAGMKGSIKIDDPKYINPVIDYKLSHSTRMQTDFHKGSTEQGAYWGRPHEMFARAFESYIATKLKDKGATNTYLCKSTDFYEKYAHSTKSGMGTIYPIGKEKEQIDKAFDKFFNSLKLEENKQLLKAISIWR